MALARSEKPDVIAEGRRSEEALTHPVWRLLVSRAAIRAGDEVPPSETIVCRFPDPARPWRLALEEAIAAVPPGGILLVTCDRAVPRAILGVLARRRLRLTHAPTVRAMMHALRRPGVEVRGRYAVWPSVGAPRVALEAGSYDALRWVQRSGVLGGGGRSLPLRALARSSLFTPFAFILSPGVALVARVTDEAAAER